MDANAIRNAREASSYLFAARKQGLSPDLLTEQAAGILARFPDDPWVCAAVAWIRMDLCRALLEKKQLSSALEACAGAVDLCAKIKDPGVLLSICVARLGAIVKEAQSGSAESQKIYLRIRELLASHRDRWIGALEHQAPPRPGGGEELSSPLERLFYLARKVALALPDGELLESFMPQAMLRFPGNEWFAEAHVRAALQRGDNDEARQRARALLKRYPNSWAVAAAAAESEEACGDVEAAERVLGEVCLGGDSPWAWQRLALLRLRAQKADLAASDLACAIACANPRDPGKTWRLHLDRARALMAAGRRKEALREARLADLARRDGGWGDSPELISLQAALGPPSQDDGEQNLAPQELRQAALRACREELSRRRADECLDGEVTRYDDERGFGFVALADGRQAFLHRRMLRGLRVQQGDRVRIRVARSFDRKKNRPGWRVAWLERKKDEPGAADCQKNARGASCG